MYRSKRKSYNEDLIAIKGKSPVRKKKSRVLSKKIIQEELQDFE